MSHWYVDTSAALKLLVAETESEALAHDLDRLLPRLAACWLLDTELRRAAHRMGRPTQGAVSELLTRVDLYDVPGSLFREAGQLLPGTPLRSIDAVHLAAAQRIGVDAVLTYGDRMAEGARQLGLSVIAPS